jgi:hypothetical protein
MGKPYRDLTYPQVCHMASLMEEENQKLKQEIVELKKEVNYLTCYKDAALHWQKMKHRECLSMAEKRRVEHSADARLTSALQILVVGESKD